MIKIYRSPIDVGDCYSCNSNHVIRPYCQEYKNPDAEKFSVPDHRSVDMSTKETLPSIAVQGKHVLESRANEQFPSRMTVYLLFLQGWHQEATANHF